ncbi:MAG: response regulator [Thermodesulfobacteriota bacterium]
MPVIALFSGTFCREDALLRRLSAGTGYRKMSDPEIVAEASRISGTPSAKIGKAFGGKTSVFNRFTHERERSVAYLKNALAEVLAEDNLVLEGFSVQLIPQNLTHVLRVCLIADMAFRFSVAAEEHGMGQEEAARLIRRQDEDRAAWVQMVRSHKDPWDPSLYDILVPAGKKSTEEIFSIIQSNLGRDVLRTTKQSRRAVEDFRLASQVEVALLKEGHNVGVRAKEGEVTLTINKHVLMLSRLEEELKGIAGRLPGVKAVATRVGPAFHQADIYRKFDFELPSKILLVDDEREFVQTLSERLLMRDMGSAVAYDGESALELIREDEPEVMILDLRMPGIDGIEVLRRVKATQPEIEVIILTGHGSEADRETCMKLGAFAYLQKPVDIEILSDTIRQANERTRSRKGFSQAKS